MITIVGSVAESQTDTTVDLTINGMRRAYQHFRLVEEALASSSGRKKLKSILSSNPELGDLCSAYLVDVVRNGSDLTAKASGELVAELLRSRGGELIELLKCNEAAVRRRATIAISALGEDAIIPILCLFALEQSTEAVDAARTVLMLTGVMDADAYRSVRSGDLTCMRLTCTALAKRRNLDAFEAFKDLLSDVNSEREMRWLGSLLRFYGRDGFDYVRSLGLSSDPEARARCAVAFGGWGGRAAAKTVIRMLSDVNEDVRYHALYALRELSAPDCERWALLLLNDRDEWVREPLRWIA